MQWFLDSPSPSFRRLKAARSGCLVPDIVFPDGQTLVSCRMLCSRLLAKPARASSSRLQTKANSCRTYAALFVDTSLRATDVLGADRCARHDSDQPLRWSVWQFGMSST